MTLSLKVYHSPDSDDAFMFYGISEGKVKAPGLDVDCELKDIQSLNRMALKGEVDCTAISFHAYAYCFDKFHILPQGASFGDGYGPRLISTEPFKPGDLKGRKIAIPGGLTTATLALRMLDLDAVEIETPFDEIMDAVKRKDADAGLIIHEGQIIYAREGFHLILDLGKWWKEKTGLPLPLGGNVIRKGLDPYILKTFPKLMKKSVEYGLENRAEALNFAKKFGRGLDDSEADAFVAMYVNDWTRGYGERGKLAVRTFLERAFELGLIPDKVKASFLED